MDDKTCSHCHERKALTEFHKFIHSKDGYKAFCKTCSREYYREYRKTHPEYVQKEREKQYSRMNSPEKLIAKANKAIERCKLNGIEI